MIDCNIFQNNVKGDPFVPTVLRNNYGNTIPAPDEVPEYDNENKRCDILCLDGESNEEKNIDNVIYSTKRQQAIYPISGGSPYSTLYDMEFKGNYELQVQPGSIIGTGTGVGATEGQLGYGDTLNSFSVLVSTTIVYENNYDIYGTQPSGGSIPLIDSTLLANSLELYYSAVIIEDIPGTWTTGTPTGGSEINNSILIDPNDFALNLKTDMDTDVINVVKHSALCQLIKDNVDDIRFDVVETDVDVTSTVGTVSYQLKLVEI